MKIETKFNIGDRVWIAYEYNGEINIYSDEIESMIIEKGGKILAFFKNSDTFDTYEDDLILYDDTNALIERIKRLDNKIIEEQKKGQKDEDNKIW